MFTPKIIALLPNLRLGCKKAPFSSNPLPYSEYLYLLISEFLLNLIAPNKQFYKIISSSQLRVDFKV